MSTATTDDWIEVPAVAGTSIHARTRYPLPGDALVVYRGPKAYVRLADPRTRGTLLRHAEVRLLTVDEAEEAGLPIRAPHAHDRAVRLGDVIHAITTRLGIASCSGCRRRQRALNRVVVWGWWRGDKRGRRS